MDKRFELKFDIRILENIGDQTEPRVLAADDFSYFFSSDVPLEKQMGVLDTLVADGQAKTQRIFDKAFGKIQKRGCGDTI